MSQGGGCLDSWVCLWIKPAVPRVSGHPGGGASGHPPGDGAIPQPATDHGQPAVQERVPAEPADQHQRRAVPGLQRKTVALLLIST